MGLFDRLKKGLQRTKELLQTDIRDLFKSGELLTEEKLEQFYSKLILTDMGVPAAREIVDEVREKHLGRTVVIDEIWATVKARLKILLKGSENTLWDVEKFLSPLAMAPTGPTVILVAGV
ncbi:MAG: signal recognition particle receptor subunit alpha, partial [Planctomycetota bacterium]|nr:signal recognition particle receptor subunit alpha [Planctomycetota bacterium]